MSMMNVDDDVKLAKTAMAMVKEIRGEMESQGRRHQGEIAALTTRHDAAIGELQVRVQTLSHEASVAKENHKLCEQQKAEILEANEKLLDQLDGHKDDMAIVNDKVRELQEQVLTLQAQRNIP
jgi:chromosome segregation ATPase